jgi:ArsR family transcriptional regulator, zinc-responsive transcriptional repressor
MKSKRETRVLSDEQLSEATECLKAMAHPVRLKILQLVIQSRHTVTELAAACNIVGPVASMQLRLLERSGLLVGHREGKFMYYQIADPQIANVVASIESRFG